MALIVFAQQAPRAAPAEDAASVMARVNAQGGGAPAPAPTSTWRWSGKDLGGYNPRNRGAAPASSGYAPAAAAASSAPAEDPAEVMARVMAMMK